ncbi:MAG: hypothetical protein AAFO82_23205, partial [Bacteroidota bacterium]
CVGSAAKYTITIEHEGEVTSDGQYTLPASVANNVVAQDNFLSQGLTIVPNSAVIVNTTTGSPEGATFDESTGTISTPQIGPNDTYEICYYASSNTPRTATNTVEITAHDGEDVDSTPNNSDASEDDIDDATVTWVEAGINIQKQVETAYQSGIFIEADDTDNAMGAYAPNQPITYRFIVENTGNVALTNVELEDDLVGFECNQSLANIPVGQSLTVDCTWPYGFAESTEPYVNTATVSSTVTVGGETKTVSVSNTASIMINSQIPLPVELLVFKVTAQAEHISLPWSTASEINNDRFVLERSEDAKFFKVIGELKGQGTTLSKNQYDYQDEEVISNVMYYYRIKQVDFDGAFEYSPTVNVIIKDDNKATKLYPNPVREDGFLKLEG